MTPVFCCDICVKVPAGVAGADRVGAGEGTEPAGGIGGDFADRGLELGVDRGDAWCV